MPSQYTFDDSYVGAAGEWALSMMDLVRIVSRMDPSVLQPIFNDEEFDQFTAPWVLGSGPNQIMDPNGRGCYLVPGRFPFPSAHPAGRRVNIWTHSGSTGGGCGRIIHIVPAYERVFQGGGNPITEPDARTPSITIGVAFNQDNLALASEAELVQIAAAVEKAGYWPDGDLFQQT